MSSNNPPQRIERVAGARRAKLTAAPGSFGEPVAADEDAPATAASGAGAFGPNDERLRLDVPPHY